MSDPARIGLLLTLVVTKMLCVVMIYMHLRYERRTLSHSSILVLVDQNALIRGYYDSADPDQMIRLERDLQRLL